MSVNRVDSYRVLLEGGEGEIVDVLQCGYKYGDKVIRYAMVRVAN